MARKNIVLLGGYGVGNYGDEAILAGLLKELRYKATNNVISLNPKETSRLHDVNTVHPMKILNVLPESDLFIISGGIFSGYIGNWGRFIPVLCILLESFGIDVEFRGLGIYPDTPKSLFPFIKSSMYFAHNISVRDKLSKKVLTKMGVKGVSLIPDLSFSMPVAPRRRAIEILKAESVDLSKRVIGFSLTRKNVALANKVALAIRGVFRKILGEVEILMIPMRIHKACDVSNDLLYATELAHGFPSVKILRGTYHPSEILSIFGLLDSCICMRFHSMVFAYRMGINMIPIPYAEKCLDFLDSIGIEVPPLSKIEELEIL